MNKIAGFAVIAICVALWICSGAVLNVPGQCWFPDSPDSAQTLAAERDELTQALAGRGNVTSLQGRTAAIVVSDPPSRGDFKLIGLWRDVYDRHHNSSFCVHADFTSPEVTVHESYSGT